MSCSTAYTTAPFAIASIPSTFEGVRISSGRSVDEKHPHRTSGSEQSNVGDISTSARRVSRKRARSMLVNRDQAGCDNGESDHPLHFRTMERSCINISA
jgi:hypothetical protein